MSISEIAGFDLSRKVETPKEAQQLDDLSGAVTKMSEETSIDKVALNSEIQGARYIALAIVLSIADDIISEDLDEGETPADRLDILLDIADTGDEADDDIEDYALSVIIASMQDAAVSLGVPEDVALGAFDSSNPELQDDYLTTLADYVNSNVPEGEEFDEFREDFVYGSPDKFEPESAEQLDALTFGKSSLKKRGGRTLVYRAVKAIRAGKLKIVNKRMNKSTRIKLSAKQKAALKRAVSKSQRGSAIKKRIRSVTKGRKLNIYKQNAAF